MARLRPNAKAFTFGAADAIALGNNESRRSIVFSPALVESYSVAFGEPAVINGGLTIRPGMQPMVITAGDVGDVITLAVHIVGSGAAVAPLLEVSGP